MLQLGDYVFWLFHASLAFKLGGEKSCAWLNDVVAVGLECGKVALGGRMGIHVEIHSWGYEDGGFHGQIGRDEHVVSYAIGHLAYGGSGGWGYEHGIGPQTKVDV